jgi:hypothetical protein
MSTKKKRCKYITTNPKVQNIFVHTIVNVIFKYMLHVKSTKSYLTTMMVFSVTQKLIVDVTKLQKI